MLKDALDEVRQRCVQRHHKTTAEIQQLSSAVQSDLADERGRNAKRWATLEGQMNAVEQGHRGECPSPVAVSSEGQCDTDCRSLWNSLESYDRKVESLDDNELRRDELDRRNIEDIHQLQECVEEMTRRIKRIEHTLEHAHHTASTAASSSPPPPPPPPAAPYHAQPDRPQGQPRGHLQGQPEKQQFHPGQGRDQVQGPFLVPGGGLRGNREQPQHHQLYGAQPYGEQQYFDPRQPRVRKFLPPAPQWLVPTQPRWAPD